MAQEVEPVLPQGVGYAVVVGIGFFFAALMCGVSYVQVREGSHPWLGAFVQQLTIDRTVTLPIPPNPARSSTLQVEMSRLA